MQTNSIYPTGLLFLDIETVPQTNNIHKDVRLKELFTKRFDKKIHDHSMLYDVPDHDFSTGKFWSENAALFAEFGKTVCVCIGRIDTNNNIVVKTLCGRFEKALLNELAGILKNGNVTGLVAHNGMEFDFPVLMRRMIINEVPLPGILNTFDKKPWEVALHDTKKMWSGTAWNHSVSLDLIAHSLGIPSPKSDMDGSMVADVWYSMYDGVQSDELPFEKESEVVQRISKYCSGDVLTLIKIYLRMRGLPAIPDKNVLYV